MVGGGLETNLAIGNICIKWLQAESFTPLIPLQIEELKGHKTCVFVAQQVANVYTIHQLCL